VAADWPITGGSWISDEKADDFADEMNEFVTDRADSGRLQRGPGVP
jgi:hypothetical protein